MARTDITVQTPVALTNGALSADAADITMTAADASNKNSCTHTGRELILAYNSGASSRTVTVTSVADELGRTLDVPSAYSLGAGDHAVFGPYPIKGWRQASDGKLYFEASHAEVLLAVIRIPSTI